MKNNKKKVSMQKKSSVKDAKEGGVVKTSVVSAISASVAVPTQKNKSKIQPLGDRVLLQPLFDRDLEKKNDFGIIIPETVSKETPEKGRVVAVGEGRYDDKGQLIPMKVRVGDLVIFSKYGYDEVKAEGNDLYILKEESILAIIN